MRCCDIDPAQYLPARPDPVRVRETGSQQAQGFKDTSDFLGKQDSLR